MTVVTTKMIFECVSVVYSEFGGGRSALLIVHYLSSPGCVAGDERSEAGEAWRASAGRHHKLSLGSSNTLAVRGQRQPPLGHLNTGLASCRQQTGGRA